MAPNRQKPASIAVLLFILAADKESSLGMKNHNDFFNGRTPLEIMAQGNLMSLLEAYKRINALLEMVSPPLPILTNGC
ncbi:hypothetical protein [Pseudomonas sp.]|jgi:hypothetical protein|uniref:hypothetical protein n=1 Tax=Pseudomonas sp. TaxID=306 RepID=UPI002FC58396